MKPPRLKELSKLPAIKTLLLLKKNISNNLRTRRTRLELLDGSKNLEVSFTIHQPGINIIRNQHNLLLKEMQYHSLHLNLTRKKLIL